MTQLSPNQSLVLDQPTIRSTGKVLFADLCTLTKTRITVMVVITTWLGFALGQNAISVGLMQSQTHSGLSALLISNGLPWAIPVLTMLGTALSCMGASALNQACEKDIDALMHRTRNRPLPTGRVSRSYAIALGTTLAAIGFVLLLAFSGVLAASFAGFTVLSYVFIYTPLKRISSSSVIIGAVPGALPPVIGFVAATGQVGTGAIAMFIIMFLWQLPHFLAIAWLYREDYARAGMPMLPVVDPTGESTFRQMLIGCLVLLPVGLLPTVLGVCGKVYFVGALLAGAGFLAFGVLLIMTQSNKHARWMFYASLVYLPVILILMVADQT